MKQKHATQVLAITSGKGGVGKTNIAINFALALAERDNKVTIMDADLGLANIDVLLNLRPLRNLSHVIEGDCNLKDIIIEGPGGIRIIPAASGIKMMSSLNPAQHIGLIYAFDEIEKNTDYLIIDTAAGISDSVIRFCGAAQEVMVVVCNDPASIADAYALIKTLNKEHRIHRFQIVVNKVKNDAEGCVLYERLCSVTERYMDVLLTLMAIIPEDDCLLKAVRRRSTCFLQFPHSEANKSFKKMALTADSNRKIPIASGRLVFFAEKLMNAQHQQVSGALS
ncbi:MAG: MinD/ParA family protein [Pseudomonadota bacterium]